MNYPAPHSTSVIFPKFIPRLYQLGSSSTAKAIDSDTEAFNDLEITLSYTNDDKLGYQLIWQTKSTTPISKGLFMNGIEFWVVNMKTITGIVATGLSSLGGTSIIALYAAIILTLSSTLHSFLIPETAQILYLTLDDPRLLLELLHAMYICRALQYPGHLKDEAKICRTIFTIFRSPEMLGALTEYPSTYKVLVEDINIRDVTGKKKQ
ncbi:hypothetical protein WA158_002480 [Blastocystis sp. Blastoise]